MAKVTVVKQENFTVIDNGIFKDTRLSFKAKGLLTTMLSLPPTWNYTIEGLKTLAKDGKDSIKTALKELEEFGYLERKQIRNKDGSFCDLEYFVYEKPQVENPSTDKSLSEKPIQLNTNISSTDESNTKGLRTDNKYALKDKSFKDCDNMYASVSEKQEVEQKPKKKSRYIPKDYTEEQLREHIRPTIRENFKRIEFENGLGYIPDGGKLLEDITVEFFRQYEENMGVKHNILPDKSYINVIRMFVCSTGELREYFDLETYEIMITRYFETDFNRYGKYNGEVTLCLSHFMNDTIRNHLLNREGILWERAEEEGD